MIPLTYHESRDEAGTTITIADISGRSITCSSDALCAMAAARASAWQLWAEECATTMLCEKQGHLIARHITGYEEYDSIRQGLGMRRSTGLLTPMPRIFPGERYAYSIDGICHIFNLAECEV